LVLNLAGYEKIKKGIIFAGIMGALLVTLSGSLHTIYSFFQTYNPESPLPLWQLAFSPTNFPNNYWYPNATRFIPFTIHEFPLYSFVVSDLHGHVLDIPFVLLTMGVIFTMFKDKLIKIKKLIFLSFLLSIMYTTNAWDGLIYFLLAALVIFYLQLLRIKSAKSINTTNNPILQILPINIKSKKINNLLFRSWFIDLFIGLFGYLFILGMGLIIFTLPFNLNFKPFVSGFGVICAPDFLTNIGKIGPLLFEKDHCQRSLLWQLITLYGFFYFFVASFIVFLMRESGKWKINDVFILILILLSTILIIIPEFIYAKDIYPAHYRANTMFKLVYQSFIMLSLTSTYILFRVVTNIKRDIKKIFNFSFLFFIFSLFFSVLVMLYPYFAVNSYYADLKNYKGIDGTTYLKNSRPFDYQAINWLNKNIKGQPVILEAQGDSYTD